jgi:hypothetical protein
VTAATDAPVRPARSFADRLGYVIAAGSSAAEVSTTLDAAAAAITVEVSAPRSEPDDYCR